MPNIHEDFKKANYSIPILTLGGSTRTNTVSTGGGVGTALRVVSGSDTVTLTMWGQRQSSTGLFSETLTVTATSGVTSVTTDWLYCFGAIMDNKYGTARSTESADITIYSGTSTGSEIVNISSSEKSKKAVAFALQGHNATIHTFSGNNYLMTKIPVSGTTIVEPTSNNAFKFTADMITDERIQDYLFMDSDTGGATAQIRVWQD